MRNFILITSFLLASTFVLSGCAVITNSTSTTEPVEQQTPTENQFANSSSTNHFQINYTTTTLADLIVGKKIMVIGTANDDGTINASQITLGEFPSSTINLGERPTTTQNNNQQDKRERPQPPDNTNFSGRQTPSGPFLSDNRGSKTSNNFIGEIIKIDDNNLVLKMNDGGSKIVFYSNKTEIRIMEPPPTEPGSTPPTN